MEIKKRAKDGDIILEVKGDIDFDRVATFTNLFNDALQEASSQILVDLAGVNYIDSCAVAALIEALQRCRAKKITLKLIGLTPKVKEIFETTRLGELF